MLGLISMRMDEDQHDREGMVRRMTRTVGIARNSLVTLLIMTSMNVGFSSSR